MVPAVETFRLQQALIQAGLDNSLTCLWEAGVRHRITPEALAATVAFFRQHL
ncbi:esterase [compost metagenome]